VLLAAATCCVGKILARARCPGMRTFLLSIITLATLSSVGSAADTGDNFYGYWQWKAIVIGGHDTFYVSPQDACRAAADDLGTTHGDPNAGFIGIVKRSDFTDSNNYLCQVKLDGKTQTVDAIASNYLCPPNADVIPIKNPGAAADLRCFCKTGPCYSSSPPSYDTSERCVGPQSSKLEPATNTLSLDQYPNWMKLFNRFKQDYADAINMLDDPKECYFDANDIKATVNIGYLCGFRDGDERAANAAANLAKTPDGFTWHHDLLNMGELSLVRTTAHEACHHSGGGAAWAKMFGWTSYPNALPPLYPAP
jgi:hypothetical protein